MKDRGQTARWAIETERCRRDAHFFLFESRRVVTKDEHDETNPVKPVPDQPYLRAVLDCLLVSGRLRSPEDAQAARDAGFDLAWLAQLARTGVLCLEKSRDMFVTWLVCGYVF